MCLYFSPNPQARGNRSSGCCIQPHRNLTAARIARGRPPLLRRLLTRSALGLDGSTIMFSAVIAYGMIAVTPPEFRRTAIKSRNTPAPLARPFRTQKGSRRNADIQLSKSLEGFKAEFFYLTPIPLRAIRRWYLSVIFDH